MTHKHRSIRMLTHAQIALGVLIMGTAAANASADVLYDTLSYSDDGLVDASINTLIGGQALLGQIYDMQGADDFALTQSYSITSVTADYTVLGDLTPADGFLVEFFQDDSGAPSDLSTFATITQNYSMENITGKQYRYSVDITDAGFELGAGDWWVSIVPVDETASGGFYDWMGYTGGQNGLDAHRRGGGTAHGNGYPGFYVQDWNPDSDAQDLAMRIQGNIPAPGGILLLGLAGFCGRRRKRRERVRAKRTSG